MRRANFRNGPKQTCLLRVLLLLLPAALVACDGLVSDPEEEGRSPAALVPDVSAAGTNCSTATFADLREVKAIYDRFFARGQVRSQEDFGWHADPGLVSAELVKKVVFPPLNTAGIDGHAFMSFDNCQFERGTEPNADIFGRFNPWNDVHASFRRFNPRDFTPAAATYYARSEWRDRIAEQFVYRAACFPDQLGRAIALCPDCDDVFVPLSRYDLYRIFEVRFVREQGGQLQVSRLFKFIGIDASGDIRGHAGSPSMRFARVGGETLWAKWRGEISGRLYALLGSGGPVGMMIRSAAVNDYGCGAGAPAPLLPEQPEQPEQPQPPEPPAPPPPPAPEPAPPPQPPPPSPPTQPGTCSYGSSGDHGDPCSGVAAETWRCVQSPKWGVPISQVCRGGIWQTFNLNPSDCASCCGSYSPGCAK